MTQLEAPTEHRKYREFYDVKRALDEAGRILSPENHAGNVRALGERITAVVEDVARTRLYGFFVNYQNVVPSYERKNEEAIELERDCHDLLNPKVLGNISPR